MSYTETTRINIFSRFKNSIGGIVVGVILFVLAFPVLWLNEGRAVKTSTALNEIDGTAITVSPQGVSTANNGKLVYLNGPATSDDVLTDAGFNISEKGLKLNRRVEMFQWREISSSDTKEKVGGTQETTTTYTYEKVWDAKYHNSNSFKVANEHINPPMRYSSASFSANNVSVGVYTIDNQLSRSINASQPLVLTQQHLSSLEKSIQDNAQLYQGGFYLGKNPANPTIGDYRISYTLTPNATPASILAKQDNKLLTSYTTSNGKNLAFLRMGNVSADEIIRQEKTSNTVLTWILRVVGILMMHMGLSMIAKPLSVLASVLPPLGRLVGKAFGLISLLVSAAIGLLVIAIAWIFYRPVIAISLIAVAVALYWLSRKLYSKGVEKNKLPQTPPPISQQEPPPFPK